MEPIVPYDVAVRFLRTLPIYHEVAIYSAFTLVGEVLVRLSDLEAIIVKIVLE
jgi:hypothetical protein